jgi:hypothetical protein
MHATGTYVGEIIIFTVTIRRMKDRKMSFHAFAVHLRTCTAKQMRRKSLGLIEDNQFNFIVLYLIDDGR